VRKTRRLGFVTPGVLVIAAALVACGDDGNSQDEDDITAAIEFATASGDPAACTKAQTQRFTEQVADETTGEAAVKECERNAADPVADSIEVSNIEVDGDSATAEGAITGTLFDGQTIAIVLVNEDGQWKLDEATGFVGFDRDTMLTSIEQEFGSDPETPPKAADCVVENFGQLSDQEIQDFFLGTASPQAEDQIFGPCFGNA
jgi:hypothetical protein